MSKAQFAIIAIVLDGHSKSEVARGYEVPLLVPPTGQTPRNRRRRHLHPRSRRPHTSPRAITPEFEGTIIRLRNALQHQGYDAGPATIAEHLYATSSSPTCQPWIHHTPTPETTLLRLETL